jgi:hypothetical protein
LACGRSGHAAQQFGTYRHLEDAAGGLDLGAFGDVLVVAEHHGADRILLQVERETEGIADELEHFAVACVGKPVDAHDAVGDAHHRADIARLGVGLELLDARLDQVADFRCLDGHINLLLRAPLWPRVTLTFNLPILFQAGRDGPSASRQ